MRGPRRVSLEDQSSAAHITARSRRGDHTPQVLHPAMGEKHSLCASPSCPALRRSVSTERSNF